MIEFSFYSKFKALSKDYIILYIEDLIIYNGLRYIFDKLWKVSP